MSKLKLIVVRTKQTDVATNGEATLYADNIPVFKCHTIENTKFIVVAGEYDAVWTKSPRFSREATARVRKTNKNAAEVSVFTWEILGVLDGSRKRAGIRIHAVNFAKDLLGCVALGMSKLDLDKDGNLDLGRSREAMNLFHIACGDNKRMKVKLIDQFKNV